MVFRYCCSMLTFTLAFIFSSSLCVCVRKGFFDGLGSVLSSFSQVVGELPIHVTWQRLVFATSFGMYASTITYGNCRYDDKCLLSISAYRNPFKRRIQLESVCGTRLIDKNSSFREFSLSFLVSLSFESQHRMTINKQTKKLRVPHSCRALYVF
jgi:hypothetical protein